MMLKKTVGLAVIVLGLASQSVMADVHPTVIYGADSRIDLFEVTDAHTLDLADSTVALLDHSDIHSNGNVATLTTKEYGADQGLCDSERFYGQKSAAFCSGSLVGDDLILTAGHCVLSQSACKDTKFVFGFGIKHSGDKYDTVPTGEVYGCAKLIKREQIGTGADYALVKLDRKVTNHTALQIKRKKSVVGAGVMVIGHPSGLPTKVATGVVRSTSNSKFILTNLDTYGGNSGSAVFDSATGEVEGILVRGDSDFRYDGTKGCVASNVQGDTAGRGEDVTRISVVASLIDAQRSDGQH